MDYDGAGIQTRGARATAAAVTEASSSLFAPLLDEETLWQMNMRGNESMESGSYPQRPGVREERKNIRLQARSRSVVASTSYSELSDLNHDEISSSSKEEIEENIENDLSDDGGDDHYNNLGI
ncbi:hypothetical protein COCNU_scaffold013107G000010 [Cocos nucifera]|nr:hypothetical protein [Cocos nucifera]